MYGTSCKKPRREGQASAIDLQASSCDTTDYQPYHSVSGPGYASSNLARRVRDADEFKRYQYRRLEYVQLAAGKFGVGGTIEAAYAYYYDPATTPVTLIAASWVPVGPLAALANGPPALNVKDTVMVGNRCVLDALHVRGYLDFAHGLVPTPIDPVPRAICRLALVYFDNPRSVKNDVLLLPDQTAVWDDDFDGGVPPQAPRNKETVGNCVVLWERTYRGGIDDNISYILIDETIPINLPCQATLVPDSLEPNVPYQPSFMTVAATNQGLLLLYANGNIVWSEATSVPYFKLSTECYFH